jgi:hypothetical protein
MTNERHSMRKVMCAALLSAVSAFAAIAPAAGADSRWTGVTDPLGARSPNGSFTHPAGYTFSVPLLADAVTKHELQRQVILRPPAPAGTLETHVRGEFVLTQRLLKLLRRWLMRAGEFEGGIVSAIQAGTPRVANRNTRALVGHTKSAALTDIPTVR